MPGLRDSHRGSGTVITLAVAAAAIAIVALNAFAGWNATWRSFGVVPLEPHFFDMRAVTDHAACAAKGFDAYTITPCASILPFNYPPIWLWVGKFGIDENDAAWLSLSMAGGAFLVLLLLLRGRSAADGLVSSLALLSPPVAMAVERGNIDLFILALVGFAALTFSESRPLRYLSSAALVTIAVFLKLYPVFCIALAARTSRRTVILCGAIVFVSALYFLAISQYLPLIRQNTLVTYVVSYGYKVLFVGLEHLRSQGGRDPIRLADTWAPLVALVVALGVAALLAMKRSLRQDLLFPISRNAAGNAFLFGSGIYIGTFMLGSNFMYRIAFLLLCLPQVQDWTSHSRNPAFARALIVAILCALWSSGSNGLISLMIVSQIIDWGIFFGLSLTILSNATSGITKPAKPPSPAPRDTT
jgi:hypothetical protein